MKKTIHLILVLLMLTGCGSRTPFSSETNTAPTAETVPAATQTETTQPETVPTEPETVPTLPPEPESEETFVRVLDYIPTASQELRYATENNFTGQVIYPFEEAYLRWGTVKKLMAVSEDLEELGLYLKIWDGFRPVSAQFKLWEVCPDSTYVANPNKGYSNHSRGYAVDLTLIDREGKELEMPTGFDDFSAMADRDYSDCSSEQAENAHFLETVMEKHGFKGYWGEWWHFNDTKQYDVETCFDPGCIAQRALQTAAPLLKEFWQYDSDILTIPAGESVTILGYDEEYALVEYWGYRGYVPQASFQ
mgnify:CR=1 FL=1